MARQLNRLIIHHTASPRDTTTLEQVDAWHKVRWPNFKSSLGYWVGYHVLIGHDWIKQTRAYDEEGANTYGYNSDSIGICLTGNFENEVPNLYQLKQLRDLLIGLMAQYKLGEQNIYLHRDLTKTACPGKNITHALITSLFHPEITVPIEPTPDPEAVPAEKKLSDFISELGELIERYK